MAEGSQGKPHIPSKVNQLIDLLAPIQLTREGIAAHLWRLVDCDDEFLPAGAVCTLFDCGGIKAQHIDKVQAFSSHLSVRTRLFDYFISKYEYDRAQHVADMSDESGPYRIRDRFEAILNEDWQSLVEMEGRVFLKDGQLQHLGAATEYAEKAVGWQEAAIWGLRTVLLTPIAPQPVGKLFSILEMANRFAEMQRMTDIFRKVNLHRDMCLLLEARLRLQNEDYAGLTKVIPSISFDKLDDRMKPKAFSIMARACEAQGKYKEAIGWFDKQNNAGRVPPSAENQFLARINRLAQINVGELAPDPHTNYFAMLGFPRSGTTLLENALAVHPGIETFEEVPSETIMFRSIASIEAGAITNADERRKAFEAAREVYYADIKRRARNPSAVVFVDKMPIRSAYIQVLEKIFPQRKYIFSIRHPYDVVLSCFQQRFKLNQAMENFRRFDDACTLYAEVMKRWFQVFPDPTERVHYIKYEDMIVNFDEEMRRVLTFLGVEWNDAVRDFAAASERRKVATPSYSKVRSGLGLGVQTRWRNYQFLFQTPAAAPLKAWVERFGYEAV